MPLRSGVDVLKDLKLSNELPPTIILTTFDDDVIVLEGIRKGAKGYLLKDVSLEQLVDAIRIVYKGGTLIQPAITECIVRSLENVSYHFPSRPSPDPLT